MTTRFIIKSLSIVNGVIEGDIDIKQIITAEDLAGESTYQADLFDELAPSIIAQSKCHRARRVRHDKYQPRKNTKAFQISELTKLIHTYSDVDEKVNANSLISELKRAHLNVYMKPDNRGINVNFTDKRGLEWLNQIYQFAIL